MKAYLLTHLILYVLSMATTKRERDPYSDGEMALLFILHVGAVWWTAHLMWNMP